MRANEKQIRGELDGILIHDWAGHPFQLQLSRELARRGNRVEHFYCSSRAGCKGRVERSSDDPPSLVIDGLGGKARFAANGLLRRAVHELAYGVRVARLVRRGRYALVMSSNTPLLSQWLVMLSASRIGSRFVFWQQDMIGPGATGLLSSRLGRLGRAVGRLLSALEGHLLRGSDAVVAISDDYIPQLRRWGVPAARVHVIGNWAPLDELPERSRKNDWAVAQGLTERPVFLYSGTLARKHNPRLLLELAVAVRPSADVVVISEGEGAEWLRVAGANTVNLRVLPFVDYSVLPDALSSADVLVAVLHDPAGAFSVPSKVLTYLCMGRPILASIPSTNLAARILRESGAGIVAEPGDSLAFTQGGAGLASDAALRARLGCEGRRYAEQEFDIARIAHDFELVFRSAGVRQSIAEVAR